MQFSVFLNHLTFDETLKTLVKLHWFCFMRNKEKE